MLDLRFPIGAYFLINTVILIIAGLTNSHPTKIWGCTINLDLVWSIAMGLFGALMLSLSAMDKKKASAVKTEPAKAE